ncbi:WYL domain-containing protein [Algoriphagus sp. AGSA1]|uniref:helix-turn-helix transcriptional regulator n=1 Tax=Algoriphagus sp. AGSA1 TaxID=2907213 RepID=UPI001F15D47C|nr:WYL domain-containing protein [Algoriphagus sp. AGSA1]MCE7057243.1 WYL domain-containing protein [Algoriphagus sp. AGSA1]
MAWNKNALIRYRTIDKCLQNHSRKWTLEDLIEACSEVLYELEGKDLQISKRTIQLDIQLMRSDKLGYNAPIQVYERKYYCYSDPDFSITDIPLTKVDMDILTESVEMLKQFKEFSLFQELNGVIQKLEDKVYNESKNRQPIIHIDKNESLKGLRHIDKLCHAISKQIVLKITYQSFISDSPATFDFHGYILKEFNNRWFLVGRRDGLPNIRTLALDRILKVDIELSKDYQQEDFSADQYYANTYGISVLTDEQLVEIEMRIDRENAPYVLTKPFHASQKLLEAYEDGSILISFKVHHNFEIERLLLGFADSIEILKPQTLRDRLKEKFERASHMYQLNG